MKIGKFIHFEQMGNKPLIQVSRHHTNWFLIGIWIFFVQPILILFVAPRAVHWLLVLLRLL